MTCAPGIIGYVQKVLLSWYYDKKFKIHTIRLFTTSGSIIFVPAFTNT
jgi:hypothetical protein